MTSNTETATTPSASRCKSIADMERFVQGYLKDSEIKSVIAALEQALACFENYKKTMKETKPDFESAYAYYRIAYCIISQKIPSLQEWSQFLSKSTRKEIEAVSLYEALEENIRADPNFEKVEKFLRQNAKPPSAFDFKHKGSITTSQLKLLLDKYGDEILLVDYRSRDEFKRNHIRSDHIICIEPVSVRSAYRDVDIEELSLVTSPEEEKELFSNRSTFELVIVYDNASRNPFNDPISKIYHILSMRSFEKPFKRTPVILEGGIAEWISNYGIANYGHNHGDLSMPERLPTRRPSENSIGIARNFNEYLSNPVKTDFHAFNGNGFRQSPTPQHNGYEAAPMNTYVPLPKQQITPPKRSNSLKMPSFSAPKLLLSSKQSSKPSTPTPPTGQINFNNVNNAVRTQTPQPQFVVNSYSNEGGMNTLDASMLHCTTGLCNLGNSCYMNCIIQCLLGNIQLVRLFYDGSYKRYVNINSKLGTKGIMARYFAELVQYSLKNSDSVYEPRNFKSVVGSINAMFRNNDQQDCSEFLNFVLDGLHEDLNENGNKPRAPPPTEEQEKLREAMPIRLASSVEWERYLDSDFSAIVYFFQGQYASQLKCLECGTTSTTYQSFSVLSLPIPEQYAQTKYDKIPLDKCFEEFTKLEVLDGDNRWHCSKCKQLRKSTKKITITRLPDNLIVHLKRFRTGSSYQKVTSFVDYPFEMDLTKYWPTISSPEEAEKLAKMPQRNQVPPFNYKLYAVANHSGTLGSGHYTSYVWKGVNKKWCLFDDTRVTKNVQKHVVVNLNAYVLFYSRAPA